MTLTASDKSATKLRSGSEGMAITHKVERMEARRQNMVSSDLMTRNVLWVGASSWKCALEIAVNITGNAI